MSGIGAIRMPKRFDYSSISAFNNQVEEILAHTNQVTLDCADMEYIDSAGIGLLVMAHRKAQSQEAKIILVNMRDFPKEILILANLQKIIEMK
ncbi:STAS domain-containing protein [Cellvibrio sp. NN19]|uniref:STAS domain-containing protein n=1 Tax=Cellvibrio chitinivorans TaxID=3102792 RepID=UPI002B4128ED|nr:STAS domain-containing protein [Cellvibrio sp. NN19]